MDEFMAEAWNGDASMTVKDALVEKVANIGENLNIRRFEKIVATTAATLSSLRATLQRPSAAILPAFHQKI